MLQRAMSAADANGGSAYELLVPASLAPVTAAEAAAAAASTAAASAAAAAAAAAPLPPATPPPASAPVDEFVARIHADRSLGRVTARRHSAVTLVFPDVKGFTSMCADADPADVSAFVLCLDWQNLRALLLTCCLSVFRTVAMLHELFTLFDGLCDRFGLYKVARGSRC